ncbi:MAG: hypothetical protein ABI183_02975 [Polyangiaceae bacterium]
MMSASTALSFTTVGCGGPAKQSASPSEVSSQPAAADEPDLVAVVVGTTGRDQLLKDGYSLTKIADIIDVFKPDMLLIQVRADAYKQQHLEDASFEMTYVNAVAGTAGVDVEPIDWFKDEDSFPPGVMDDAAPTKKPKKGGKSENGNTDAGAAQKGPLADPFNYMPPITVDPDNADAYKTETSYLTTLGPLSFADANNDETTGKIWDAMSAQIRYTKGYSSLARRVAWMDYNGTQAFMKQKGATHRLMVVVNVRYRAAMEQLVAGFGAVMRDPSAIAKSDEQPHDSVSDDVVTQWRREVDNLKEKLPRHGPDTLRTSMLEKIAILNAAVSKKGTCCVDIGALAPKESDAK